MYTANTTSMHILNGIENADQYPVTRLVASNLRPRSSGTDLGLLADDRFGM